MKPSLNFCLLFIVLIGLSGCTIKHHANTQALFLADNDIPKLNINHPVAIKNSSSNAGTILLCEWFKWDTFGDLYKFTNNSVEIAKNAFERQNIKIDDKAEKILELSVNKVTCLNKAKKLDIVTTTLKVRTGDGLEKEYEGVKRIPNFYIMTNGFERAMADCVSQMLNDKDILRYLEN